MELVESVLRDELRFRSIGFLSTYGGRFGSKQSEATEVGLPQRHSELDSESRKRMDPESSSG
ncbi:MAG: hypothetical protein ABFD46_05995 [Armatimonadota bacterium]